MNSIVKELTFMGIVITICITTLISSTLLINSKGISDAELINIAGSERMLTQKMLKELYTLDFISLYTTTNTFEERLALLEGGQHKGIKIPNDKKIKEQLEAVKIQWNLFRKQLENFKHHIYHSLRQEHIQQEFDSYLYFYGNAQISEFDRELTDTNLVLLWLIDDLVTLYTEKSIATREYLSLFQYVSALILLCVGAYGMRLIWNIKKQFDDFIAKSKQIASMDTQTAIQSPLFTQTGKEENEFCQVALHLNTFLERLNIVKSSPAQAKMLSEKISNDINAIIDDINHNINELHLSNEEKNKLMNEINISENIAIESSEQLITTAKLLEQLKESLENVTLYLNNPK
ncbi:hypothetical protein CCZ01_03495 [Helicobacter monodelphidis]|uniref:type IV pili methyl-accepting chemotaxis transducer N-terminal domain-containing protein n=1 Tax=Helicobacter sp. 15-1451 TaxID=2004995 RepID=UPI000DCAF4C9|nr:type IV pili methyl-accepting chemotaxis transducer N-terminal domain-containing protein [Helicobacter sp. 15-1451]RAX58150.1 hypothetical protein CCZ01_03495 [Helicobacter sp. 15-1451]